MQVLQIKGKFVDTSLISVLTCSLREVGCSLLVFFCYLAEPLFCIGRPEEAVEPGTISLKTRFFSQWHPLQYLFKQAKFYIQEGVGVHVVAESMGYAPVSETLRHQHNEISNDRIIVYQSVYKHKNFYHKMRIISFQYGCDDKIVVFID